MHSPDDDRYFKVRGTDIRASDTRDEYRRKLARVTLDSMIQFVGLLDANGTVLEINQVALDGVGITLAEVEGKPFWTTFWWQVNPEINTVLRESIARAARGELVRWDTPIYGRSGGAETIVIDASLCPVMDDTGRVVYICAEGRDITEKKAQERLLAEKNAELEKLLERIRELDETRTQFFANVSHELRTPLQLIIGPADRLSRRDVDISPAQRQESAQVIGRNARMLLKHVNDLLDVSKLDAGKLKMDLRDVDLVALLRLTTSNFTVLADDRGIIFRLNFPERLGASVDPEKIQRVVMNLVSNAFKFAPDGGTIAVTLRDLGAEFDITVEDSGPGVRVEHRRVIFERFRQGEGGANRRHEGTGLGLAIAKEFTEMHGGSIAIAESSLGGASFQVRFPLHRRAVVADGTNFREHSGNAAVMAGVLEELHRHHRIVPANGEVRTSEERGARPTVLVVEDNRDMNRFIAEALGGEYHIVSAYDGEEGLAKALEARPALIVTDIMMPRVSGPEMIEQIRQRAVLADVPILLLTAKADEDLKVGLLNGSAQDFVSKPFSERDLLVRVRNLIESKRNQDRHRTLFDAMDEGFCMIRVIYDEENHPVDYRFLEVNGAFEKQTGVRGAAGRLMREIAPDLEPHWFENFGRIALTGEAERFESRAEVLGRWYQVYAFRVGPAEDRQLAIFFNDITERRNAEQALRLSREALQGQAEDLRAANRSKDEFLAMLAHELRNPIAPLSNAAELLKLEGVSAAERAQAHGIISRQISNMSRLLDDLLDVSRINEGKVELRKQVVSLQAVLTAAQNMVQSTCGARTQKLTVTLPEAPIFLDADATRLEQIFGNLLGNACKYSGAGSHIQMVAELDATLAPQEAVITVKDDGAGIDPELLPRIFDLFVQESRGLDRAHGGLGIGLTLVKRLVELHGGSVEAKSEGLGRGAEFIVRLPVCTAGAPTPAAPIAAVQTIPRRMLVVDDNLDSLRSMAMLQGRRGHKVRTVSTGSEALAAAAEFLPDVVLLDIGLPGMDGYEVARQIRAMPQLEHILLIAMTGYANPTDRRMAKEAGFDEHLVKPVDLEELRALLESHHRLSRGK